MFGQISSSRDKDKVKSYNRVSKGKNGFKVIRVKEFLRKKDEKDNTKRNLAIGAGVVGLGIGAALLLKKKGGMKFLGQVNKTNSLAKIEEKVVVPKQAKNNNTTIGEKKGVSEKFSRIADPWDSPITNFSDLLTKPKSQLLLPPTKEVSAPIRPNIKRKTKLVVSDKDKVVSSVVNMRNTQKSYDSLPLDMKATIQIEKLLRRPTKVSNLGRPPESTGLKVILDEGNKTPIDKVISKAKRKVGDRLKRENELATKKESLVKKK